MFSKCYKSTEVDRRTRLHVPSGTHWSTINQVAKPGALIRESCQIYEYSRTCQLTGEGLRNNIWLYLTFYLIVQGFHRTYATGAACQQRTLTPPDTWSCPSLGLACVLMSIPISPELVLSSDFWISNIPRYFSLALNKLWSCLSCF